MSYLTATRKQILKSQIVKDQLTTMPVQEDYSQTNGRKNNSNQSPISITANIDRETCSINEKINSLKQTIKDTQEQLQIEKIENNKLEETINHYLKENERLIQDNRSIERKVNQVVTKLKSTHNLLDNICSRMNTLDVSAIRPNRSSDNSLKPEVKGTYLTVNSISKISDIVDDMQPIGHGGEGRVYKAILKSNGNKVVVKSYFMDCEQSSRIEYAMLILCSNVRGVKTPVGLFNTSSHSYLIMEDNHKSIPLDIYSRNNLSENQIQHIFSQMAHILLDLRNRFIKHRDVKLENFLLNTENGRLTIIDFGWAMYSALDNVSMEEVKRSGENLMGTNDYLPPEAECPHGTTVSYDKATVFALGCVLLELYFGYQGKVRHKLNKVALYNYIEQLKKETGRFISKGALSLLEKCLRLNSKDRFSLEEILQHPWVPTAKHDTAIFRIGSSSSSC